ncbi:polyketide synthase, partial [Rhodobacteraceae bacterium 4F10]
MLDKKSVSLTEITNHFKANDGYLNVALRTLCSQGWLTQHVDNTQNKVQFEVNKASAIAFSYFHIYKEAISLLKYSDNYSASKCDIEPFEKLENLYKNFTNNFG